MKTFKLLKLVLVVIAALAVVTVVGRLSGLFPSFSNLFGGKLTIDKTANVISEIKKISEFTTACFFEEESLEERKYDYKETPVYKKNETGNLLADFLGMSKTQEGIVRDSVLVRQIAFIVQGKVRAGFDLSKLSEESMHISGDTLSVKLPDVEIFDVIVNPSDISEFDRIGDWTEDEINAIIVRAKDVIEKDAVNSGLIKKAQSSGQDKFVSLFKTFGFNEVVIK